MGDKLYCIAIKRLRASHGSVITYSNAVTGSPVSEIGCFFNLFIIITYHEIATLVLKNYFFWVKVFLFCHNLKFSRGEMI